jgi:bifunctional DNase/RNase
MMTPKGESVRLDLNRLMLDPETNTPIMILTSATDPHRVLPIWCGMAEANAMAWVIEGTHLERPMTYDLLASVVRESGGRVNFVEINEFKDETFHAEIHLGYQESARVLDARPTDAINLALRTRSRIYITKQLFETHSVQYTSRDDPASNGINKDKAVTVVFSYSHRDEILRNELDAHLKLLQRQGLMSTWSDRKIVGGERWADTIDRNFAHADLVILLVSADFLASDYCYEIEMKIALERASKGESLVIPVILRACDWSDGPFGHLQALPVDAKPITSWKNRDEAWHEVVIGIKKAMREFDLRRSSTAR